MKLKKAFFLTLILLLNSCGKSVQSLTDTQVQRIRDFSANVNQVNTTAGDQGLTAPQATAPTPVTRSSNTLHNANATDIPLVAAATMDENTVKMKAILKKAVADKLCSMRASTTAAGSQMSFGGVGGVDLTGTGTCPATFSVSSQQNGSPTVSGNKTTSTSKIAMSYQANTAEFKKLADIDQFSFTADIAFELTQLNRLEYVIKSKFSGSGTVHSQKTGKISISLSSTGELEGNSDKPGQETITGNSTLKMDFSDFLVQLDTKLNGGASSYTLNGDSKTEAEITDYFSGLIIKP